MYRSLAELEPKTSKSPDHTPKAKLYNHSDLEKAKKDKIKQQLSVAKLKTLMVSRALKKSNSFTRGLF